MSGMLTREMPPTDPELLALLERAREHVMSPAEIHAQKRSWVIGEMGLQHPEMARHDIEALVDRSLGPAPSRVAAGEEPGHYDAEYGIEVRASDHAPGRPVAITLPSDVWMDTESARAFAAAIVATADHADAHPELYPSDGPAP